MTQDEMKKAAGWAALKYVEKGSIVGVGTGSTVNHFIDALGTMSEEIKGRFLAPSLLPRNSKHWA